MSYMEIHFVTAYTKNDKMNKSKRGIIGYDIKSCILSHSCIHYWTHTYAAMHAAHGLFKLQVFMISKTCDRDMISLKIAKYD